MDNDKKLVTQIPLTRLWKDEEDVVAKRSRYLTTENIKQVLKEFPVEFVIADIGCKLQWIGLDASFDFWKTELRSHLINDRDNIDLDQFPDNYAYVASQWFGECQNMIILLEKHH